MVSKHSYYEILCIGADASITEIKKAYKIALLQSHPDKRDVNRIGPVTVNEIQDAYKTLIDPKLRKLYDEELSKSFKLQGFHNTGEGLDVYSLMDFCYEEDIQKFTMNCPRCSGVSGFELTEESLEEHAIENEEGGFYVLAQCSCCSLWLKILFDVVEEN